MDKEITLLFDVKLQRPACVLLQAMAGSNYHKIMYDFDPDTWLLSPTPDMKKITGTKEQWAKVANR